MQIEVHGLTRRFGDVLALDEVSFTVPAGRRVALVGPNGSGKSTLNRVLMGLVACSGSVRLDGHSPFRERVAVAHRMAYVPQIAPQLAAPVRDLLRAVAGVRELRRGGFEAVASHLDLDLAALGPRPFRSLSGGMRQKLLITLAFASDASLLVLDEPTGSLDAQARERFFELFEAIDGGSTLLLCSHRLEEVRPLVDDVLYLSEGRLAWQGAAAAFLEACGVASFEVWADGDAAAAWLRARGFRRSAAGPWLRSVPAAEKMKLHAELARELGSSLRNLNVRDLENLDLGAMPDGRPRG